jgi:hypothetical protein
LIRLNQAARNFFPEDAIKLFVDPGNVKEVETLAAWRPTLDAVRHQEFLSR